MYGLKICVYDTTRGCFSGKCRKIKGLGSLREEGMPNSSRFLWDLDGDMVKEKEAFISVSSFTIDNNFVIKPVLVELN